MSRRHALRVICFAFVCSLTLNAMVALGALAAWPDGVAKIAVPTSRVVNGDIYGSAAMVAQRTFPAWAGVRHVVIASGEAAALSDAVVASSLCWAYDAPLLLVGKKALPTVTRDALAAIASANPDGDSARRAGRQPTSPAGSLTKIRSAVAPATVEQPWQNASRYSLAASVAQRVDSSLAGQAGLSQRSPSLPTDPTLDVFGTPLPHLPCRATQASRFSSLVA